VEDGATVKIYYESRLAKVNLTADGRRLIDEFDREMTDDGAPENQKAKTTPIMDSSRTCFQIFHS